MSPETKTLLALGKLRVYMSLDFAIDTHYITILIASTNITKKSDTSNSEKEKNPDKENKG